MTTRKRTFGVDFIMIKKKRLVPVLLSAVMIGTAFTGCASLLSTNSQKDMEQIVATVDISLSDDFAEGGEYNQYADVIGTANVLKRDLVAYFLNEGYNMVQNYGYTYADTFDLMLESLVNRKIVSQYAMVYFFENSDEYTLDGYNAAVADSERPEIDGLRYFLDEDEYNLAVYSLRTIINDTLDDEEEDFIAETEDIEYESDVRTTPTGVDEEVEDYYDPDYRIYTGKNATGACGSYETVDGSTPTTRKKAYNLFLANLKENYLLSGKEQNLDDFESLDYWYIELQGQLESALITKLGDEIEEAAEQTLTREFVESKYEEILSTQQQIYDASADDFETDIAALSDSSFVLYSPIGGYGFVYNILLPFSSTQSYTLSAYQNDAGLSTAEYYEKRAELLSQILATDQRGSWLTGSTDYSFKASENDVSAYGGSDYLFFENNMLDTDRVKGEGNGRYESLDTYYGHYAYNGKVEYDEEESDYNGYTVTPNKISVDGFIDEMEGYLRYAGLTCAGEYVSGYGTKAADFLKEDGSIDYSKFVYYKGSVAVDFDTNYTFYPEDNAAYTAMSVVNELSFAYNTDTAGLNSYLGYAVSVYDTSYVDEFEYAAKLAVEGGVGTYTIAPSDYGWHIMYCTYTFDEGEVYSFNYDEIGTEGTFSYFFYEALKASSSGNTQQVYETQIVNRYNNASCVKTYEERYADYSSLSNN